MFQNLSDNLEGVFKKLRGHGKLSEKNISDAMREIRLALLEADVEFSVAKEFINSVKEKSLGEEVLNVKEAQAEAAVEPNRVADDLGRESVSVVTSSFVGHMLSVARLC